VPMVPAMAREWLLTPSHHAYFAAGVMAVSAARTVSYSVFTGYAHFAAGLCCGFSGLAAGVAIGIAGDAGVRAVSQQPKMYVGMVLILIFAEALGLYGLIIGLIIASQASEDCGDGR